MRTARWSDNDRHLGPITYGISTYRLWGIVLISSGDGEDYDRACQLRINLSGFYLIIVLPNIVRPHKTKVYAGWDRKTVERLGRDFYWDVDPRQYGFSLSRSGDVGNSWFLQVFYGRTGGSMQDSLVQQQWSRTLPWTNWRHVRISFYDLDLRCIGSVFDAEKRRLGGGALGGGGYEAQRALEERTPKQRFRFRDFDGEELVATCHVEEREWRRGTGWFKWLSLIWPKKIRRYLDIAFSGETGKRKGSWKGGTLGHSIEMRYDDTHFQAFLRYCKEHGMEFVGWETKDVDPR